MLQLLHVMWRGLEIELGNGGGTVIPTIIGSAVFHRTLKKHIFKSSATQ